MPSYQRIEYNYLNEEVLMAEFRRGDSDSIRYIFENLVRPLACYVENIVFSSLEAEDIVASCFSKLLHRRDRMQSLEHVKRSLYKMARNESIDYLRRRTKHREINGEIAYLSSEMEDHAETERVKAGVLQMILAEIERLPRQRKRVFKLIFFEQKSTAEIAELLGIGTQTVLNQKTKALEALRRKFPQFSEMSMLVAVLYIGRMFWLP